MKTFLIMILLLASAVAHAEDTDLVKASKKVPAGTVITNDSVKKNATASSGAAGAAPPALVIPKGALEVQAEQKRLRDAADSRVHDGEAAVTKLEKELAAVEQSYYDESNPDVRDREITRRFAVTGKKLETAKKELTVARDAAAALWPKNVIVHP
jgi:hypothetical protein